MNQTTTSRPLADIAPRPRPGTGFFAIGDGGVAFNEGSQNLFAFDALAAFCWLEIEAGRGVDAIARDLAEASGEDAGHSRAKIDAVLESFATADLLDNGQAPTPPAKPDPPERPVDPPPGLEDLLAAPARTVYLRAKGTILRLDFSSNLLADKYEPIYRSLAIERPEGPARHLAIIAVDNVAYGCDQGEAVYSSRFEGSPAAVVERLIWRGALFETECLLSIHCGSVAVGASDVNGHPAAWLCLPAPSGSGKTTLTAALTAAGFPCGSDELIVLRDDLWARPMTFPLCIKKKSWPVLAGRYPELDGLPEYSRYGFRVRYLRPRTPLANPDWRPIGAFVFPRYATDGETDLRPIGRIEGMQRLFDQCLTIPKPLDLATVGRLVGLCAEIPFYELPLSDLDTAIELLREMAGALEPN